MKKLVLSLLVLSASPAFAYINARHVDISYQAYRDNWDPDSDFWGARGYLTRFTNCNLEASDMTGARFGTISFDTCNLRRVNFHGTDVHNAYFGGSDLQWSRWYGTNASGANFKGADLRNINFIGCDLRNANFCDAIIDATTRFPNSELAGSSCRPK